MLVRVESQRAAIRLEVAVESFEVARRALAWHEPQLLQSARRVVDEDQQRTGFAAVFEPAVFRAVDLHQFAHALAPEPRLMKTPALLARQPHASLDQPLAQRLPRDLDAVPLDQHLRRKRRTEVTVVLPDQLQHQLAHARSQLVARRPSSTLVDQGTAPAILVPGRQPLRLPQAHTQHACSRLRRPPARQHLGQHLDPS